MSAVRTDVTLWRATRHNVFVEEIPAVPVGGQVTLNTDARAIKMSLAIDLAARPGRPEEAITLVPLVDFVAPVMRRTFGDGTVVEEQIGLFGIVPPSRRHAPAQTRLAVEGRDLCWLLCRAGAGTAGYTVAAGTNLRTAVVAVLEAQGITRHSIPATTKTLAETSTWRPGTAWLQVANDLLQAYGCYDLTASRRGVLESSPYADLGTTEPAVSYSSANGGEIVGEIDDAPDWSRLRNRVIVVKDNPAAPAEAIVAEAVNDNPSSPTSIPNLGEHLSYVADPLLADQAAADALARRLLDEGSSFYRKLTLRTRPDPRRNPREIYDLDIANAAGEVATGRWRCLGWKLPLQIGTQGMEHFLSRVEAFGAL